MGSMLMSPFSHSNVTNSEDLMVLDTNSAVEILFILQCQFLQDSPYDIRYSVSND